MTTTWILPETTEVPPDARPRRRHRGGRRHRRTSATLSGELRAWGDLLDDVLSAVEATARSARRVAGSAQRVRARGEHEGTLHDVAGLPGQMSRLVQTGWMLAQMAAGYRLHRVRTAFVSGERSASLLEQLHEKSARRFYEASVVHGGAFLKVGQLVSARVDLLPAAWIRELSQLQDAAPAFPFDAARAIIEADLGRPLGELFSSFDEAPIAAASIGQVHRAVTTEGASVAVKVQRPGIAANVRTDLKLLELFVSSLADSLPEADYATILGEVKKKVMGELDYEAEAKTAQALSALFASHGSIVVPAPLPSHCGKRVLTTAFVEGEKITTVLDRLDARAAAGDAGARGPTSAILGSVLEAYLRMVLQADAFQADPHPGNLLVTPDGKLAALDFGCAQAMPREVRDRYLGLMQAFMAGDRDKLATLFVEIGFVTRSGRPDTLHRFADALLAEIRSAALGALRWPTREEFAARISGLLAACEDDPVVSLPAEFVMIARVFGTLGGLFARYKPDLDFARHVLPVLGPVLFS